ncbi:MAG: heparan-alpha-glucosaminide N-acetyltransferase [Faecalibacterium sp.]
MSWKKTASSVSGTRYALLDELRGLNLISMILYHAMWDCVFLLGFWVDWYVGWQGRLWQQCICWVFILLSGFCVPLGRHTLRRGLIVSAAGLLVTVVTLVAMPSQPVLFGVLTLLGAAMILTALLEPLLRRVRPGVGLAGCMLLFALTYSVSDGFVGLGPWTLQLPYALYANLLTAFFGFYPWSFYSSDYFPLLPWLFLFWAGYFLHHVLGRERLAPLQRSVCPPLGWLGRHSLLIYLLHQPVLFALMSAAALL